MRGVKQAIAILLVALTAACTAEGPRVTAPGDATSTVITLNPNFLQRSPSAPAFANEEVHLPAVAGVADEITLYFADGSPFATFRTGEQTLRGAQLQGRPIPPGDTVWITMRRVDNSRFMVKMEPSGLIFNPRMPAELTVYYRHSSYSVEPGHLSLLRQENDSSPWEQIPAQSDPQKQVFRAPLEGFTKYAMASGN